MSEFQETTKQVRKKPKIIAVIPAYNEEKTIATVIIETEKHVNKIIVVDDGSTDHTAEIAQRMGAIVIQHPQNMGKGAALKTGFKEALKHNPDIVVTLDADLQHNPSEIPKLVKPIIEGKADLVIGSRYVNGAETNIPCYRKIGLKIIHALSSKTVTKTIKDTQSGFRAFKAQVLNILTQYEARGYGVETEQLTLAVKYGLKIAEIPVTIKYDVEKPSKKNPFTHGAEIIATIIRIMTLEQPLKYLGIPSVVLLMAGIIAAVQLIAEFNKTRYFSIPAAIISLGLTLLGAILATTALTFYTLTQILKKIEEMRNIGH